MDSYGRLLQTERQQFSVFSAIYVALRATPRDHPAYPQLEVACRTAEQCWRETRAALDADRLRHGLASAPAPAQWLIEPDDVVVSGAMGGAVTPLPPRAAPDGRGTPPARMESAAG